MWFLKFYYYLMNRLFAQDLWCQSWHDFESYWSYHKSEIMLELLSTSMLCKEHISQVSYLNKWAEIISSDVSKFLTYYFLISCHTIFIWLWNQILITSDHEIDEDSLCSVKIEVWSTRNIEIMIAWYKTLKRNEAFW